MPAPSWFVPSEGSRGSHWCREGPSYPALVHPLSTWLFVSRCPWSHWGTWIIKTLTFLMHLKKTKNMVATKEPGIKNKSIDKWQLCWMLKKKKKCSVLIEQALLR
jgi:hypothetical protein